MSYYTKSYIQTSSAPSITPVVGPNREDEGNGRALYIIVGAVVGGVVVFVAASIGFALIVVIRHKHIQRKAGRQQEQRNGECMHVNMTYYYIICCCLL